MISKETETCTFCPVCGGEVKYYARGESGLWYHVHAEDARRPEFHDVNTYAPYELKRGPK